MNFSAEMNHNFLHGSPAAFLPDADVNRSQAVFALVEIFLKEEPSTAVAMGKLPVNFANKNQIEAHRVTEREKLSKKLEKHLQFCRQHGGGGEAISVWPSDGSMESTASKSTLRCLYFLFHESIHSDVTINTANGIISAHKAILTASSPVFHNMFPHNLRENQSSTIDIEDMSWESCMTLLTYLYGDLKHDDFWKHMLALLGAANKYDIADLKGACEESLLEDINSENVMDRLQEA